MEQRGLVDGRWATHVTPTTAISTSLTHNTAFGMDLHVQSEQVFFVADRVLQSFLLWNFWYPIIMLLRNTCFAWSLLEMRNKR